MSDDVLAQLLARLTSLEGMEARLMTRLNNGFEAMQTSLDGIREDLTVLGGADAHIRRLGDNTRDELRSLAELVAAIHRAQLKHGSRLDQIERRLP